MPKDNLSQPSAELNNLNLTDESDFLQRGQTIPQRLMCLLNKGRQSG